MDRRRQGQRSVLLLVGLVSIVAAIALAVAAYAGSTARAEVSAAAEPAGGARSSGLVPNAGDADRSATSTTTVDGDGTDAAGDTGNTGSTAVDGNGTASADDAGSEDSRPGLTATDVLGRPVASPRANAAPSNPVSGPADEGGDGSFVPPIRQDRIEFVYQDGALGPVVLGSSIDEIAEALGPEYEIAAEVSIRAGFGSGYSVTRDGEVLFWCIEEDGVITVIMTTDPRVGLDSGLRPELPLEQAIATNGEPTFRFGPEAREFVTFGDVVGGDKALSVLVAIGRFGGPVGVYDAGPEIGSETTAYEPEGAIIKELWFRVSDR